jgi:hypothetical protein
MGLDYVCRSGSKEFVWQFSAVDSDLLSLLAAARPKQGEIVLGVPDFGEPKKVKRDKLRRAVADLQEELLERDHFPVEYQCLVTAEPFRHEEPCSTPGLGVIRMPGDQNSVYWVEAGLGVCKLIRRPLDADPSDLKREEEIDIRDRTELVTANLGVIKLFRKKKRTRLKTLFTDLIAFLDQLDGEEVEVLIG